MSRSGISENTPAFAIEEAFRALGGSQKSATVTAWVNSRYPGRWTDRIIGQYLRGCSVNQATAIRHHPDFPRFLFCKGRGEFQIYDPSIHGTYDPRGYPEGEGPSSSSVGDELRQEIAEQIEQRVGTEFAYEAHLRDYLAKNLSLLENGLVLWSGKEESAVEYQLEGRRIDILAKDKDGIPVVIELKLSKGHERTIGQALFYRAKLKQLLALQRVRIIMVAAEITDELKMASGEVPDVDLFQYSLTMKVDRVEN
ncbi:MAG: DUF91 domain-containing protein [Acidobacteria bacterium]|nr:DUF91 domain-containing protein [Acidobacteriota bacterium]